MRDRSLCGGEGSGEQDARVHLPDERYRVRHTLVPAGRPPRRLPSLLTSLQTGIAPNMMNIIESADLRKESSKGFIVVPAVVDGSSPVISPLYHGARLEAVATNFIEIVALAGNDGRPVTEGEQVL